MEGRGEKQERVVGRRRVFSSGVECERCVASRPWGVSSRAGLVSGFLNGVGADFQTAHHKIHQPLPRFEVEIGGQRLDVVEKFASRAHGGANQAVARVGEFQQRVQGKSQQVHGHEQAAQVLFAVPEVVLQVIALGLEHVVIFILDLPPRSPASTSAATFSAVIFQSVMKALWYST